MQWAVNKKTALEPPVAPASNVTCPLAALAAWAREGRFKSDARAVDMCVRPVHEQLDGCPDPGCVDLEGLLRTVARDGDSEGADPVVINTVPPPDYEYAA